MNIKKQLNESNSKKEDEQRRRLLQEYIFNLEEAQEVAKEMEESILDAIPHAVLCLKERTIISANDAVMDIFGWEPEELVGKSIRVLYRSDEDYKFLDGVYSFLENRKVYSLETYCQRKNGEVRLCRLNVSRVGPQLVNKHVVAMYEDITEQKAIENALRESEEKYRNIFENTIECILQTDPHGRFLNANAAFFNLCKVDSLDELIIGIGNFSEMFVDGTGWIELKSRLEQDGIVKDFESKLYCKDKDICWACISGRSIKDKGGDVIRHEWALQDVTERKRLESQLLQSQKMEAVGTLAGGVAHDINNILMGIQGYTSLALFDVQESQPIYEKLKNIETLVISGSNLTKQLLGFARGGRYDVKSSNINDIVEKTTGMFGRTKKNIKIVTHYEEKPYIVDVDRGQIEQVLINLYVNAWQAMPGGGTMSVATQNCFLGINNARQFSVKSGKYVKISVEDTGIGIDEKMMGRIFEPFFTTKDRGRGTGLGLASAYGIIKNHGGFIDVSSRKGYGSTFTIYLPASEKKLIEETPVVSGVKKGVETILLVDDEETIIDVSKEMLELLGYKVMVAKNGRDAVSIFNDNAKSIDLIILDMIMPDMGGSETYEFLKIIDPEVKVVLSTGYSIDGEASEIIEKGCKAFIQKPFNVELLSSTIREVLDCK